MTPSARERRKQTSPRLTPKQTAKHKPSCGDICFALKRILRRCTVSTGLCELHSCQNTMESTSTHVCRITVHGPACETRPYMHRGPLHERHEAVRESQLTKQTNQNKQTNQRTTKLDVVAPHVQMLRIFFKLGVDVPPVINIYQNKRTNTQNKKGACTHCRICKGSDRPSCCSATAGKQEFLDGLMARSRRSLMA